MSPLINNTGTCRCGEAKIESQIFCPDCWEQIPERIRKNINYHIGGAQKSLHEASASFCSSLNQENLK